MWRKEPLHRPGQHGLVVHHQHPRAIAARFPWSGATAFPPGDASSTSATSCALFFHSCKEKEPEEPELFTGRARPGWVHYVWPRARPGLQELHMTALLTGPRGHRRTCPGTPAPDVSAPNQDGKVVRISRSRQAGAPLFLPEGRHPGLHQGGLYLRDDYAKFQKAGAVILGVSRQDAKSHQEFKAKYHLPFDLLSDTDGKFAEALAWRPCPSSASTSGRACSSTRRARW